MTNEHVVLGGCPKCGSDLKVTVKPYGASRSVKMQATAGKPVAATVTGVERFFRCLNPACDYDDYSN